MPVHHQQNSFKWSHNYDPLLFHSESFRTPEKPNVTWKTCRGEYKRNSGAQFCVKGKRSPISLIKPTGSCCYVSTEFGCHFLTTSK